MIDEYSADHRGWARFSDDRVMRYRLARSLTDEPLVMRDSGQFAGTRVTFLLLNPSTADAFKPDPTVTECVKRARRYGASVVELVNLFAVRTPYPADLKACDPDRRGADAANDDQILRACTDAIVIAAWGNHGWLAGRADIVKDRLRRAGVALWQLGLTGEGRPKHPLARGRHRIPADKVPEAFV